jgi:hypothetical protein
MADIVVGVVGEEIDDFEREGSLVHVAERSRVVPCFRVKLSIIRRIVMGSK